MKTRLSPGVGIALVALVVALGGTAMATTRYVITSSSQIKPSVVSELRREVTRLDAKAAKAQAKVPRSVVAHVRSEGPVILSSSPTTQTPIPLVDARWTQQPEEVDQLVGQVTVTMPSESECHDDGEQTFPGRANVYVSVGEAGGFAVES
jgi:hypothetical protein